MNRTRKIQKPAAKKDNAKPKGRAKTDVAPIAENRNQQVIVHEQEEKTKVAQLKVGSWFSSVIYNKVIAVDPTYVNVVNQYGTDYSVTHKLVEDESYSADQFAVEKKVTRTELVEVLENCADTVFTINFTTKATEEKAKALLEGIRPGDLTDAKFLRGLAKDIIQGHQSTIVGYLRHTEPKMGRSSVIDLNLPKNNNIRLVDHRNINWIILKGVKYTAK